MRNSREIDHIAPRQAGFVTVETLSDVGDGVILPTLRVNYTASACLFSSATARMVFIR
jgi:hypothetical protein